jgi:hypothetical protein
MATLAFKITFNVSTGVFNLIDQTDYVGQGIALVDVNGNIKITSPSGVVVYNNTNFTDGGCDVNVSVSTTNQTTISLPSYSGGDIEPGDWVFLYTVNDSNLSTDYTLSKTVEVCYTVPVITLEKDIDCISPLMEITDTTNYIVEGITPTITRAMSLYHPAALGLAPVTGTGITLTVNTFYSGEYKATLDSTITYDYGDNVFVTDIAKGGCDFDVECDESLCSLYCCVATLYNRYENALQRNPRLAKEIEPTFILIGAYMIVARQAWECSNTTKFNEISARIKDIANCTDDCSCSDGSTPTLIVGMGGTSITTLVSGSGITITSVVNGSTTQYTISFNSALLTKLNSLTQTVVAAGTDIGVASATVGDTTTYTISYTGTQIVEEKVKFMSTITYSNFTSPTVAIVTSLVTTEGSNYISPTVASVDTGNPNFANLNNRFKVNAFQTTPDANFKFFVEAFPTKVYDITNGTQVATDSQINEFPQGLDVQCYDKGVGEFYFRFVDANDGSPLTNYAMLQYQVVVNFLVVE